MLEFTEKLRRAVKLLQLDTEQMVVSGGIRDMEQYKFLMGRLEGYRFVQEAIDGLLGGNEDLN